MLSPEGGGGQVGEEQQVTIGELLWKKAPNFGF
jgi:hypothetical protein